MVEADTPDNEATSPTSVPKLLNVVLNVSNVFVVATDLIAILLT